MIKAETLRQVSRKTLNISGLKNMWKPSFLKFKSRDKKTLVLLFQLYNKQVYSYALYITNDCALAEDVTQEVFIKVYNKIEHLSDASKVEAWLYRVTTNVSYDLLKQRNKLIPIEKEINVYKDEYSDKSIYAKEIQMDIEKSLLALPPEFQEVFYLKYIKELTTKQISHMLEIPEGTVKSRLRRARNLVIKKLKTPGEDIGAEG
ncbi:RNA polymerase sigma factor [Desulfolucanica intricata]|uniref:RNA polymerase sigma factor n=1 Tax=Desulfolucanica intricata TaxID=1285191 RepID=UPI0008297947|nr:RNA polymerase sigma factor [Desulfolucanica intricata]